MLHVGTAGWSIPRAHAELAPGEGAHLQRYARVLRCAEINSSFYRSHRVSTWQRWREATPGGFRFSVKFPKAVTHGAKLVVGPAALDGFFAEVAVLGDKLGPILVQLPPSLAFADCPAAEFCEALRDRTSGPVAMEPRHASWFGADAGELLAGHRIGRVAADPARSSPGKARELPEPGGWPGLAYFRLHGSPRSYYSEYDEAFLERLAEKVRGLEAEEVWVIFDNTAAGHAFANAIRLQQMCGF